MTVTALVVHPDGRATHGPVDTALGGLQALVGGYLEAIYPGPDAPVDGWLAYVNEEGRYQDCAPNPAATVLAHGLGWPGQWGGGPLLGTVVFLGRGGAMDPDEHDVPPIIVTVARDLGLLP